MLNLRILVGKPISPPEPRKYLLILTWIWSINTLIQIHFFLLVFPLLTFATIMFLSMTKTNKYILFVLMVLLATEILLLMVKNLLVVMDLHVADTITLACVGFLSPVNIVDFMREVLVTFLITLCGLLHKLLTFTLHSSLNCLHLDLLHS